MTGLTASDSTTSICQLWRDVFKIAGHTCIPSATHFERYLCVEVIKNDVATVAEAFNETTIQKLPIKVTMMMRSWQDTFTRARYTTLSNGGPYLHSFFQNINYTKSLESWHLMQILVLTQSSNQSSSLSQCPKLRTQESTFNSLSDRLRYWYL